jgi:long-chain acyl-CoA synthetase
MTTIQAPWVEFLNRLEQFASREPSKIALIDEHRQFTYSQILDEIIERADVLRFVGLKNGDRVAIVAENSALYVISSLAIWVTGGVVVTVYPSVAGAEIDFTIRDADPVLVLVDAATDVVVRPLVRDGVPVALIDEPLRIGQIAGDCKPVPGGLRAPLAMICYSSGTTSRPKAIMLSDESLLNGARTHSETWKLSADDITVVCLPMAWLFGLSTAAMSTLFVGGTVISIRRSRPELVATAIEQNRGTFLPAVTSVLAKLAYFLEEDERTWDLDSLRLIVSGGEPRNEPAFDLLRQFTHIPVHDTYCASEMFPLITYNPMSDVEPVPGAAGKLVQRSELRIVDPSGKEVPAGEIGEALTRGPGLMLGYWNDPEQTALAITPEGWFRSKDLVRQDDKGYVHVVGRLSDMIIRGGSNVSPAEVESVLDSHPDVIKTVVVGQPDLTYGEEVVAVLQMKAGVVVDYTLLTAFAADKLAGFKIPTRFYSVNALPINLTTSKVNRAEVKRLLTEGAIQ